MAGAECTGGGQRGDLGAEDRSWCVESVTRTLVYSEWGGSLGRFWAGAYLTWSITGLQESFKVLTDVTYPGPCTQAADEVKGWRLCPGGGSHFLCLHTLPEMNPNS